MTVSDRFALYLTGRLDQSAIVAEAIAAVSRHGGDTCVVTAIGGSQGGLKPRR